ALKQAVEADQVNDARNSYTQMYTRYSIIQPAVLISKGETVTEKANSLFTLTQKSLSAEPMNKSNLQTAITEFPRLFDEMFFDSDVETSVLYLEEPRPMWLWLTGVGSAIICVLSFAAWRKYRYERDKVSIFRSMD